MLKIPLNWEIMRGVQIKDFPFHTLNCFGLVLNVVKHI